MLSHRALYVVHLISSRRCLGKGWRSGPHAFGRIGLKQEQIDTAIPQIDRELDCGLPQMVSALGMCLLKGTLV